MSQSIHWKPVRKRPEAAYVHIPFCAKKCGYCDFNAYSGYKDTTKRRYVAALCEEIKCKAEAGPPLSSIFFGGGTPTQLASRELIEILQTLEQSFGISKDAEVTVEANPNDAKEHDWAALAGAGFNRVSFGVQSFNPSVLKMIDRTHAPDDAIDAVELVRAQGLTNVSVDLMFGLPRQTLSDWKRTLAAAYALDLPHLSIYGLILEEKTPFWGRIQRGRLSLPGDVAQAEMLRLAMDLSAAAGYGRYELSNYAKGNFQSKHNKVYWANEPYFGFGAGAVGYDNVSRVTNISRPRLYIDVILSGDIKITENAEMPDRLESLGESMMLGLRLPGGVSFELLSERYGMDVQAHFRAALDAGTEAGLLSVNGSQVRLTDHGVFFASDAMILFL